MTFKDDMQRISKVVAKAKAEVFFEYVAKDKILEVAQEGLTKVEIVQKHENYNEYMKGPFFKKHLEELSSMNVEIDNWYAHFGYPGDMMKHHIGAVIIFDWSREGGD